MIDHSPKTQTVLITGATEGIGFELSKLFARDGYDLVLVARNETRLKERKYTLEKDYGAAVAIIPMDLSKQGAAKKLYEKTKEHEIQVDVLVNNAGYGLLGEFADLPLKDQLNMVQLNVVALTTLTHLYLNEMLKNGKGRILNVASTAGFVAGPLMAVYYATKAFVLSFTEAIAMENQDKGIVISALCPGPTPTKFQERAGFGENLLMKMNVLSAEKVAQIGYHKFNKGKRVIVPGVMNILTVMAIKFFPRKMVQKVVYLLQKNR